MDARLVWAMRSCAGTDDPWTDPCLIYKHRRRPWSAPLGKPPLLSPPPPPLPSTRRRPRAGAVWRAGSSCGRCGAAWRMRGQRSSTGKKWEGGTGDILCPFPWMYIMCEVLRRRSTPSTPHAQTNKQTNNQNKRLRLPGAFPGPPSCPPAQQPRKLPRQPPLPRFARGTSRFRGSIAPGAAGQG